MVIYGHLTSIITWPIATRRTNQVSVGFPPGKIRTKDSQSSEYQNSGFRGEVGGKVCDDHDERFEQFENGIDDSPRFMRMGFLTRFFECT
jgi:hypothetical protein